MNDMLAEFYFWFDLILVSIVGLCIGSFLNVVIYRIPLSFTSHDEGMSIAFPPSHCPSCKHRIPSKDNIPLVSYILLKGRCRFCKKRISLFYPLTEFLTLFAFVCFYILFFEKDVFLFLLTALLFCLLYVISIIDLRYYIIPDKLLLFLFTGGIAYCSLYGNMIYDILGLALYVSIFAIIIFAYDSFSDKQMLGLGDVKLYLSIVPWIGALNFPFVILVSSVAGLLFVAFWRFYIRKLYTPNDLTLDIDEKKFIPFGPAISISVFIVYLVLILK